MTQRELVLTRVYDAPRDLVWKLWTDPKLVAQWWGPKDFTAPVCEMDVRVGGAYRIVMRGPDGTDYPCGGVYREIVAPERLAFTNNAFDAAGKTILDGFTTVVFADEGGKTRITVETRATTLVEYAKAHLEGMEMGWNQMLDRFGDFAQSKRTS